MHSGQSCRIPHLQPKKVFITFQNFPHKSCTAHSSTESWDAPSGTARAVSNGTEQTEPSQLSELHTSGADKAQLLVKQAQGAPKPALFFCVLEQRHIKLKCYGCSKPTTEERPKGANSASLFRSSFFKMTPLSAFPLRCALQQQCVVQGWTRNQPCCWEVTPFSAATVQVVKATEQEHYSVRGQQAEGVPQAKEADGDDATWMGRHSKHPLQLNLLCNIS